MQSGESEFQHHARIALRFLNYAEIYLGEDDAIRASEMMWGAAAHAIKAFCIRRGWKHGKYAHLRAAMRRLATETGDDSWFREFKVAYNLHLNFYTDKMTASDIGGDLPRIQDLVNLLLAAAENLPQADG